MRGEDKYCKIVSYEQCGSPPHARGRHHERLLREGHAGITPACAGKTLVEHNFDFGLERITPACAGKTFTDVWRRNDSQDHPRMRGEDGPRLGVSDGVLGSPPHARGRQESSFTGGSPLRITPACAGKT